MVVRSASVSLGTRVTGALAVDHSMILNDHLGDDLLLILRKFVSAEYALDEFVPQHDMLCLICAMQGLSEEGSEHLDHVED